MKRNPGAFFALLCLALFLFFFVLSVGKPGLPPTLKADEPAYFLMALSLVEDGDLRCETQDYRRLFETYPYYAVKNLILMSDDGFETVYFGKPYVYSLLTTPLVLVAGANGMVAFNVVCLIAMLWMGSVYLRRFNSPALALGFAALFFFLSTAFAYVFWLQPEILNMTALMAGLFFAFHPFEDRGSSPSRWVVFWRRAINPKTAPLWSAGMFSLALYNKPFLALLSVPILLLFWRRHGLRSAVLWCLTLLVVSGVVALGSIALTGYPTAYFGMVRSSVHVTDPEEMNQVVESVRSGLLGGSTLDNSWSWILDRRSIDWAKFREDLGYFLWGRHSGLLLYTPLAVLAFCYLLLHRRRSVTRWVLIAATLGVGLFLLLKIPYNWHGGGGFVGNRYFVPVYPAFLFLVTRIRPLWPLPLACAIGGLLLGPILFTPFGAPVPEPTLQAHTRSLPYRYFPLEMPMRETIPGYTNFEYSGVSFVGRKDQLREPKPGEGLMWVAGATRTRIEVLTVDPLDSLFFEIRSWAPENHVELKLSGRHETVEFPTPSGKKDRRTVELVPGTAGRRTHALGNTFYVNPLDVETGTGRHVNGSFVGIELRYLGRRQQLAQPEHYRLVWREVEGPEAVEVDSTFDVDARVRSDCLYPIKSAGPLPVLLSYRWFDASGKVLPEESRRSKLPGALAPGEEIEAAISVRSPRLPGRYRLRLDAVREGVAWFSERGGETMTLEIQVGIREQPSAPTF